MVKVDEEEKEGKRDWLMEDGEEKGLKQHKVVVVTFIIFILLG